MSTKTKGNASAPPAVDLSAFAGLGNLNLPVELLPKVNYPSLSYNGSKATFAVNVADCPASLPAPTKMIQKNGRELYLLDSLQRVIVLGERRRSKYKTASGREFDLPMYTKEEEVPAGATYVGSHTQVMLLWEGEMFVLGLHGLGKDTCWHRRDDKHGMKGPGVSQTINDTVTSINKMLANAGSQVVLPRYGAFFINLVPEDYEVELGNDGKTSSFTPFRSEPFTHLDFVGAKALQNCLELMQGEVAEWQKDMTWAGAHNVTTTDVVYVDEETGEEIDPNSVQFADDPDDVPF